MGKAELGSRKESSKLKAQSSKQKTEGESGNVECGLRPVGAIGAYAPEGSGKWEVGMRNLWAVKIATDPHGRTRTQFYIGFYCLCLSVANHINEFGMFRLGIEDFGLRPVGGIGAYAPEGLRIKGMLAFKLPNR